MDRAPPHVSVPWSALSSASLAIVVLDADARVQVVNDAATARWPTVRVGASFVDLIAAEARTEARALFGRLRTVGVRETLRAPAGRSGEPAFELACTPIEGGGFVLVAEEESAREQPSRRERDNVVSDKMQAVAQLAGGVAHDLNNALAVILPNAEALVEQLPASSELRDQATEIAEVARHASHVVTQLTALGLRQPANARAVDVAELITRNVGLLQRTVGTSVTVEASASADVGSALVDPGHLQQVLVNLVLNAADAMPSGGAVHLAARARDVGPAYAEAVGVPPGVYVVIEVSDEGHGISKAVLPRIFEPFFTTRGGGVHAGLGLAAVLGLVRQARGGVTVDSAPSGGARFTVLLPKLALGAGAGEAPETPRTVVGSPRILLVDDEPNVRSALGRLLGRYGFDVLAADGGLEALEILRVDLSVRAVLSDIVMPDMDGIALARAVTVLRPGLPMVLMSGYTSDGTSALEELSVPFLQKPFSSVDVVRTLLDVIDATRARASLALGSGMPPSFSPESGQVRRDGAPVDVVTHSASRRETRRF
jgi:signal transduction histidine kinase/ActR/RegA family two-component response regulator